MYDKVFSIAYLQDLIPTLAAVITYIFIPAKVGIKSYRQHYRLFLIAHAFD